MTTAKSFFIVLQVLKFPANVHEIFQYTHRRIKTGFELTPVNPFLIKQMPGRKSGMKDAHA
jgi:hypothetical protein